MSPIRTVAYRYSGEQGILLPTLLGVIIVIAVTSTVTACTGFLVIVMVVGMTYFSNRSHHALVRNPEDLRRALQSFPREDDTLAGNLAEVFATHPRRLPRIHALREYAATPDYRRLQTKMNGSPI